MAGIFKLTSGGLMVNYRCSARCGHCLYNCSPDREGDYISADLAKEVFLRVRALGTPSMHISGGEPFLDVDKLCAVLQAAQEAEMPIDYIETSSSFVTNEEQALRTVLRVRDLGVWTLSLSISPITMSSSPWTRCSCSRTSAGRRGSRRRCGSTSAFRT